MSADASGDESAAKYSEMSAILGFLGHVRPTYPSLCPPPKKNDNINSPPPSLPPSPYRLSRPTSEVGWRVTFKVVDTLTGSSSLAGRPFEEQPHELYRKWKVYTGN